MDSIIYKLYEGQLAPMESSEFKPTRFQKRRDRFFEKHQPWLDRLEKAEPQTFEKLMDLLDDQWAIELDEIPEAFCEGFTIGAQLMVEVFTGI